jgi:uncharacterized protein (DUF58 family)
MPPPPVVRLPPSNELGHAQANPIGRFTRIAVGVGIAIAVLAVPVAFLVGPFTTLLALAVAGFCLFCVIYVPRRLRITRAGTFWTVVACVLLIAGFVGMYHEINLLIWPAYAGVGLILLNGIAVGWGLEHLRGRRHVIQPIFAQTPFLVEVEVYNPSRRDLWGVKIIEKGSTHAQPNFCVRLEARGRRAFRHEVTLPFRGTYFWAPLIVSSSYPFGLVERRLLIPPAEKTLVLPALGRLHRGRLRRFLRGADPRNVRIRQRPKVHRAAQDEFHGLRPYRPGDSPRWVHWRTSARRGELMVREFEDLPSENLLLVFDPTLILDEEGLSPGERAADRRWLREQFEQAVCLVATVAWDWCRRRGNRLVFALGGKNSLVLDGPTNLPHAYEVLEFLARCRPSRVVSSPRREDVEAGVQVVTGFLRAKPMPAYSALIVTIEASAMVEPLQAALNRPVSWVDVTTLNRLDFYEAPAYIPWDE